MTLDWTANSSCEPELLDEDVWDAPRRLTREQLYAESGSFRWLDWPDLAGDMT